MRSTSDVTASSVPTARTLATARPRPTQLVQPFAEEHPSGDRQDAGDRQHAEYPRSGLRQVQGEPDEPDDDRGGEEAVQQAAELERALPEHRPVPSAREPERDAGQHEDDAAGNRHGRRV